MQFLEKISFYSAFVMDKLLFMHISVAIVPRLDPTFIMNKDLYILMNQDLYISVLVVEQAIY